MHTGDYKELLQLHIFLFLVDLALKDTCKYFAILRVATWKYKGHERGQDYCKVLESLCLESATVLFVMYPLDIVICPVGC